MIRMVDTPKLRSFDDVYDEIKGTVIRWQGKDAQDLSE